MNKHELLSMSEEERVKAINEMLLEKDVTKVEDVAIKIGISPSTLGKLMTQEGQYSYSRSFKQYVPREGKNSNVTQDKNEVVKYLQENYQLIKRLLDRESKTDTDNVLVLSPKVVQSSSEYVVRNTKVGKSVNEQFTKLCEEKFSYLKMQDLLAQAMVEFTEKYG